MMAKDILEWVLEKNEFSRKEFTEKFKFNDNNYENDVLKYFIQEQVIFEPIKEQFHILEKAKILKNKLIVDLVPDLDNILKDNENLQSTNSDVISWDDLNEIDKFVIFEGSEKIYEIYFRKKKIKLEGKEILDYNIFRLRFFEETGVMLSTYRGIMADWANLVSHWYRKYGEVSKDKIEVISDIQEAKEIIINYIEGATISDNHIVREGIVCVKDDCIFVPTKIIKKLLKRNELRIGLRKLAYEMNNYMESGSVPLKIMNKSERFWKFKKNKFEIDESNRLELEEEEDV